MGYAIAGGLSVLTSFISSIISSSADTKVPGKSHCGAAGTAAPALSITAGNGKPPPRCAPAAARAVASPSARRTPAKAHSPSRSSTPRRPYYLYLRHPGPRDYDNLNTVPPPQRLGHSEKPPPVGKRRLVSRLRGRHRAPLYGDLVGDENGTRTFTYFVSPETFRIAAPRGKRPCCRPSYTLRISTPTCLRYPQRRRLLLPVWETYLDQFLCTCIPTLQLEGLVCSLRYSLRKNWKSSADQRGTQLAPPRWCWAIRLPQRGGFG